MLLWAALHSSSCIFGGRSLLNTWFQLKSDLDSLGFHLGACMFGSGWMRSRSSRTLRCEGDSAGLPVVCWILFHAFNPILGLYPKSVFTDLIDTASQNDRLLLARSCVFITCLAQGFPL